MNAFDELYVRFMEYREAGEEIPQPYAVAHETLVSLQSAINDGVLRLSDHHKDTELMGVTLACEESCPWR